MVEEKPPLLMRIDGNIAGEEGKKRDSQGRDVYIRHSTA